MYANDDIIEKIGSFSFSENPHNSDGHGKR